jgi:hypothetical protein
MQQKGYFVALCSDGCLRDSMFINRKVVTLLQALYNTVS